MKTSILRAGMALSLLLGAISLSATTYYCSPSGSGNGMTYGTPCSLSTGITKLSTAGDTLYLLGGQYDLDNTPVNNKNGNASKNIVISGYPGEKAILDFRNTAYGTRGLQIKSTCSYLHVKDLTLRYSGKNNLYNEGSYCTFENLDIYGSADTGCQMKVGGNNLIKNCDSHDNFDYKLGGLTAADFGGNADGFADKQHSGASNHYVGCRSWNNSDDGWDFFSRDNSADATPTIIEKCVCFMNGPAEYDMRNHPRYQTDKAWFDQFTSPIQVTDADGNTITVSLQHYTNLGNGNGFKVGGNYTTHNVRVHHCLAVGNTVKGFDQNNDGGAMEFYNCTGYLNGANYGFTTKYGSNTLVNCISLQPKGTDSYKAQTVTRTDHNSWQSGYSVSASDFLSLDTTQILLPREANGEMKLFSYTATSGNTLLHLPSDSRLKDAGADVGLPYMGTAPELGCFELDGVQRPSLVLTSGKEEQWVTEGEQITPLVYTWGGTDNKPTSQKPAGIESKVSNTAKTITFSGAIAAAGTYTIRVTTSGDSCNVSLSATIHVKSARCKKVAYVTTPGSSEDQAILTWLGQSDSIAVTETDATDATVDYSGYDVLVLSSKPNSSAAGFLALEGYQKPMVVLKPFLAKTTAWGWGEPQNTTDLSITVKDTTHALFRGINFGGQNELQVFSQNSKYAVTAMLSWQSATGMSSLASPVSNSAYDAIAEFAAGSSCGGTTIPERLIMIGFSEYSTAFLTESGLRIIENAVYYQLGQSVPERTAIENNSAAPKVEKFFRNGHIYIRKGEHVYTTTGILVE